MTRVTEEPPMRFGDATPGWRPVATAPPFGPAAEPETGTRRGWRRVLAVVVAAIVVALGMVAVGRFTAPGPGPSPLRVLATGTALSTGVTLTSGDLVVVEVANPPRGHPAWLQAGQRGSVVGRAVAGPLPAGTLLTPSDLTGAAFPPAGLQLIGLELKGSEVPTGALAAGDRVTVVNLPAATQPPYPGPIDVTIATVWSASSGQSGTTDVDLLVPTQYAATLTDEAAHDELALVRVS